MAEAMFSSDINGNPKPNFRTVIVGDNELLQLNHRLPGKINGPKITQRGMCEQTYHLRCLHDFIYEQSVKNKHMATEKVPFIVKCENCYKFPGATPLAIR